MEQLLTLNRVVQFGDKATDVCSSPCMCCRRKKPFDAPIELVNSFIEGKIVLFAGAGVSTEAKGVMPNTLHEEISHALGKPDRAILFPDLAEELCKVPSGRIVLVQKIKERFNYIYAHSSIYDEATRFHRQLATFYPITTIVTTNWDTYFEDECGATAFVEDKDLAFWHAARRRVLKLHGTIANFGSIVATRPDYKKCARRLRTGVLGAHLKSLLATRSTVFMGYSLRDDDFLHLYHGVRKHLADFHRQPYFIAPQVTDAERERLSDLGLYVIETDGEFFLQELKKYAEGKTCFCSDKLYDEADSLLDRVAREHIWLHATFSIARHPQILLCSWYQDGMMDALRRMLRLRKTGIYSSYSRLRDSAASYERFARLYRKKKNYSDAAFVTDIAPPIFLQRGDALDMDSIHHPFFSILGSSARVKTNTNEM